MSQDTVPIGDGVTTLTRRTGSQQAVPGNDGPQRHPRAGQDPNTDKSIHLGAKLRRIRADRGWTLEDASRLTGIARSTFSKIENGLMSPTFDLLQKILAGMQVDILDFFKPEQRANSAARRSITRLNEGLIHQTATYCYELLAADLSKKDMLPFKARIHARSFEDFEGWMRHDGEEFLCVISGEIEVLTEFYSPVRLGPGESIYFDSQIGHALISTSQDDATIVWVSTGHAKVELPVARSKAAPVAPLTDAHKGRSRG